jgi:mannose-6-phosphate isomerase-like protein (cupin superfamily)
VPQGIIFKKPWGWEFEAYSSQSSALWFLNIKGGAQTSMHCHVLKTTGYIVLEGSVEIEFLSSRRVLHAGDSINLRRGVFHQTKAIGGDAKVMEIESPNCKEDLIRLEDLSGRKNSLIDYDQSLNGSHLKSFQADVVSKLAERNSIGFKLGQVLLRISRSSIGEVLDKSPESLISLLGGECPLLVDTLSDMPSPIFSPGNISTPKVLSRMRHIVDFSRPCDLLLGRLVD